MKFAIIAAGEGSRLRAQGIDVPKPLLPIGGVPLVERLLVLARENGATSVACIVNETEEASAVRRFLAGGGFGLPVQLVVRTTPSSLHSVHALQSVVGKDEPFCLFTVDAVFRAAELAAFLRHAQAQADCAAMLAVTGYVNDEKPLYVRRGAGDVIAGLEDTRPPGPEAPCVTGGIYYFFPSAQAAIEEAVQRQTSHLRNALRLLLQRGTVKAFSFSRIVDVDDRSDIEAAEELLAAERREAPAPLSEA